MDHSGWVSQLCVMLVEKDRDAARNVRDFLESKGSIDAIARTIPCFWKNTVAA